MVLVSTLLILGSVCLIAFGLAGDSTTELRIAGNRKLHQQVFNLSDGGANIGVQVLLDHLDEAVTPATEYPSGTEEIALIEGNLYLRDFVLDSSLLSDIKGYATNDNDQDPGNGHPDVSFELSSASGDGNPDSGIAVDVDRISAKLMAGSSIEFAAGYEGVGKGAGTGSIGVYYAVSSEATTPVSGSPGPSSSQSARADVTTVYRKVSNVIGGAQ